MALNLPPAIVQKVARLRALQYKGDNLVLWDTPCILTPIQMEVYKHLICRQELGEKYNALVYKTAELQGKTGVRIVNKKFGYAESMSDKKRLLDFNLGQLDLLGYGKVEAVKADFVNLDFVIKANSVYAKEYKAMAGTIKEPVDIVMAATLAGGIGEICSKDLYCVETRCIVKGDSFCEFLVKPLEKLDKKEQDQFKRIIKISDKKLLSGEWKVITRQN